MVTNANFSRADGFMSRLLLIDQRGHISAPSDEAAQTRRAENALTISLLFSGLRCILQYALLPSSCRSSASRQTLPCRFCS